MKRAATICLRDNESKNRAFFSKLSKFHFDLRPPGRQDRGAKTRPQGQLECANPRGSSGEMVGLGID